MDSQIAGLWEALSTEGRIPRRIVRSRVEVPAMFPFRRIAGDDGTEPANLEQSFVCCESPDPAVRLGGVERGGRLDTGFLRAGGAVSVASCQRVAGGLALRAFVTWRRSQAEKFSLVSCKCQPRRSPRRRRARCPAERRAARGGGSAWGRSSRGTATGRETRLHALLKIYY